MKNHLDDYKELGSGGANADLPTGMAYKSVRHRISDMEKPTTHAGELELAALAKCIKHTVVVHTSEGERYYGNFPKQIRMKFTLCDDSECGHYEPIIEDE